MIEEVPEIDQLVDSAKPKRRQKNFPLLPFEDVLVIAKTIHAEAIGGQLRRLTVFDRLGKSPDSGPSRQLITASSKYGLTTGSYKSEYLSLTDAGQTIAAALPSLASSRELAFSHAINRFDPFGQIFEKLVNLRLPAQDVLQDEFRQLGLDPTDRKTAAQIFIANIRYLGLIRELSGNERVIPIEQLLEDSPAEQETLNDEKSAPDVEDLPSTGSEQSKIPSEQQLTNGYSTGTPSVNINIQIHIDASATPEQIEQIFAGMARHLYGRKG